MEWLDVVDENGIPVGETVSRDEAHEKGVPHRTSHVWILRMKNGRLQILLQKRSDEKDSFPGCYDISSAGHIPAGEEYIPSAIRELEEELDVQCRQEDLVYCGMRRIRFDREFHGKMFHDRQVTKVFLLWLDRQEEEFVLQKEEISAVKWFDFEECLAAVRGNTIPHCIYEEELKMVGDHANLIKEDTINGF
ncbi:MAG: NUDIX domain-containing protein [Lachnospiraceae bacterium]|nr:NUDIX domain-containing protein [Lachnospiraceae bacterium]